MPIPFNYAFDDFLNKENMIKLITVSSVSILASFVFICAIDLYHVDYNALAE